MQQVEVGLIVGSILTIVVVWAVSSGAHLHKRSVTTGAVLGIVPGILGAMIVLIPRTDLIPDGVEPLLWILVGLIATGIVLIALSVGFARR